MTMTEHHRFPVLYKDDVTRVIGDQIGDNRWPERLDYGDTRRLVEESCRKWDSIRKSTAWTDYNDG
jgi:hypothetical protein